MTKVTTKKTAATVVSAPAKRPAYTPPANLIRFETRFRDGPNGPVKSQAWEPKQFAKAWETTVGASSLGNKYAQLTEIVPNEKGAESLGRRWTFEAGKLTEEKAADGRVLDATSPTGTPMASKDEAGRTVAPDAPKADAPKGKADAPKGKAAAAPKAAPKGKADAPKADAKPVGEPHTLDGVLGRFECRVGTNRDALLRRLHKSFGKPVGRDALLTAVYGEATPDSVGKLNMVLKGIFGIIDDKSLPYTLAKDKDGKDGPTYTLAVKA